MIFDRVYLNVYDGKFYIEDVGTAFDNFWTSLLFKGVVGKALYRLIFKVIIGISKITRSYKISEIIFD